MQEMMECTIGKNWMRKKREGAEKRDWKSETGKSLQREMEGNEDQKRQKKDGPGEQSLWKLRAAQQYL